MTRRIRVIVGSSIDVWDAGVTEEAMTAQLHVPVLLPAAAALKMCEALLDLGLSNCLPGIHAGD